MTTSGQAGRQVGDKCSIIRPRGSKQGDTQKHKWRQVYNHWAKWPNVSSDVVAKATTTWQERKPGDNCQIMWPGHATLSKEQESFTGKPGFGKGNASEFKTSKHYALNACSPTNANQQTCLVVFVPFCSANELLLRFDLTGFM